MESTNPYAPTTLTSEVPVDQQLPKSKVTSVAVASKTMAGISLSGALFGIGLVLVIFIVSGSFEPPMLLYVGIAFGFGLVIAGIAGFVTVAILMGLFHISTGVSGSDDLAGSPWTVRRVVCFSLFAGSISGFASLATLSRGAPNVLIWGLVPAVVGAIGAYVMNRPCLRRLRQERLDRIANQSRRPDPLIFEDPTI